MIVTLSDYILEQEVSAASCDDITMEQGLAEMQVYAALANAYAKQFLMLEYASEYTMEADDETATQTDTANGSGQSESKWKKFWRTIWEGIKHAIEWLGQKFRDFGAWIKSKFSKKAIEKAEEIAESGSDEEVAAIVDEIVSDYNAAEGAQNTGETISGGEVSLGVKLSALDILTAYEVDEISGIIEDIGSLANELASSLKSIYTSNKNKSYNYAKGLLSSNIEKLGGKLDALQARKANAGWVQLAKTGNGKRELLSKMTRFVKWMTDAGYSKLDTVDKQLNEIVKDEGSNMDFSNSVNPTEMTKVYQNLQKTIFNVTHGLGELSVQTRKLATTIQKEVAAYNSNAYKERHDGKSKAVVDYEEKQKAAGNPKYQ